MIIVTSLGVTACKEKSDFGKKEHFENAEALQVILSKEVALGAPKERFVEFAKDHGWSPTYDTLFHKFYLEINTGREMQHRIVVQVWVDEAGHITSYKASNMYTAP